MVFKLLKPFAFFLIITPVHAGNLFDCHRARLPVTDLACNIYHEARGESWWGKIAVATVTLNRLRSSRFPNNLHAVIWQHKLVKRRVWHHHRYHTVWVDVGQFAWTTHPKLWTVTCLEPWLESMAVATIALLAPARVVSHAVGLSSTTFYYHTPQVNPIWDNHMKIIRIIGKHIFYVQIAQVP